MFNTWVLVGFLQLWFHLSLGCRCIPPHPQTKFCEADFVVKGKVLSLVTTSSAKTYRVQVTNIYKRPSTFTPSFMLVKTGSSSASCGLVMSPGSTWLLSGSYSSGSYYANTCGWNVLFSTVTKQQLAGLNGEYGQNCQCELQYCLDPNTPCSSVPANKCPWRDYGCRDDVCVGYGTSCSWKRNCT